MIRTVTRLAILFVLAVPLAASARTPQDTSNVNTRYEVERVSISGVDDAAVSQSLRDEMQKMVGQKYDPRAAERLATRLEGKLHDYRVSVKVKRGEHAERVEVVFEAERRRRSTFDMRVAPLLYTTKDHFSLSLVPSFETRHNYFAFGVISDANDLLERNRGVLLRYERRQVGTDRLRVGLEYDYFHPSFRAETEAALAVTPEIPGGYRNREVFSPSVSVLPVPQVKVTFGATFQMLQMQYPTPRDEAANAFTFGVQYRQQVRPRHGVRHVMRAEYSLRDASDSLESDFFYRRQWASGDYTLRVGRQSFGVHAEGGHTSGIPPLFERFTIGNATTLRGWDKFEVAPLGGTRLAYGSLVYRYRPVEIFYDFGSVWNQGQQADVKHSVGFGLSWHNGCFVSLGVPLRYHRVTPVFMFGIRR